MSIPELKRSPESSKQQRTADSRTAQLSGRRTQLSSGARPPSYISNGRIGFNVVTSVSHRVAQNYRYDRMFEHDERYVRAEEWMDAVSRLWESRELALAALRIVASPAAFLSDQHSSRRIEVCDAALT
ncbi:hypothetical protein GCM10009851_24330 [Herbiconiux moechotypicola]|uniref:Luciferase-like domain-containing protein n=1 Tax=Herbiconiux moechotypicola TaxID=637393 RepID=A0ABP5QKE4_9MICO